jgi:hypothetical protein
MRMSKVYRRICTKVYNPAEFESLQADVAESMALLEMEFPPSFFDIMTHLPYHLVQELDLCGPVNTRWMYPVERFMKTLKGYVRNMARPEASIAEEVLEGAGKPYLMTAELRDVAHQYVLRNISMMQPLYL